MKHAISTLLFTLILTGCAGGKIKKQIADDLTKIVQAGDCEQSCESLKAYIKHKLSE